MSTEVTYTQARARLASLCTEVTGSRGTVVIRRRGADPVALISAAELSSLQETAHLLRSPRNAERLLRALARVRRRRLAPRPVSSLRRELGL